jgi:hypothetical protein
MQILYNKVSVKSYKINNKFPTSKFISKSINYLLDAINNYYFVGCNSGVYSDSIQGKWTNNWKSKKETSSPTSVAVKEND